MGSIKLKVLNEQSFKFIMSIVQYLNEKEFVTLGELFDTMIEEKWNRSQYWCDSSARLAAVLRHRLCNVVTTKKYHLNKSTILYSLVDHWVEALTDLFNLMKDKGERIGYYGVKE